jgi:hypothetical protein
MDEPITFSDRVAVVTGGLATSPAAIQDFPIAPHTKYAPLPLLR